MKGTDDELQAEPKSKAKAHRLKKKYRNSKPEYRNLLQLVDSPFF